MDKPVARAYYPSMMNAATGTEGRWTKTGQAVVVVDLTADDAEVNATGDQIRVGRREPWGFSSWLIPVAEFEAK